jgi:hypothetical protein
MNNAGIASPAQPVDNGSVDSSKIYGAKESVTTAVPRGNSKKHSYAANVFK